MMKEETEGQTKNTKYIGMSKNEKNFMVVCVIIAISLIALSVIVCINRKRRGIR